MLYSDIYEPSKNLASRAASIAISSSVRDILSSFSIFGKPRDKVEPSVPSESCRCLYISSFTA